jgi:hypothetical protein
MAMTMAMATRITVATTGLIPDLLPDIIRQIIIPLIKGFLPSQYHAKRGGNTNNIPLTMLGWQGYELDAHGSGYPDG